jgi:hypothetical protein
MFPVMRLLLIAFALFTTLPAQAGGYGGLNFGFYNDPLVFGMSKEQVARIVDAPLIYLSGPRDSARYLVERPATVPGIYPVDARIVLQFRNGRLTGWRRDWQMRPYWF